MMSRNNKKKYVLKFNNEQGYKALCLLYKFKTS